MPSGKQERVLENQNGGPRVPLLQNPRRPGPSGGLVAVAHVCGSAVPLPAPRLAALLHGVPSATVPCCSAGREGAPTHTGRRPGNGGSSAARPSGSSPAAFQTRVLPRFKSMLTCSANAVRRARKVGTARSAGHMMYVSSENAHKSSPGWKVEWAVCNAR